MPDPIIERVYSVKIVGFNEASKSMDTLTSQFAKMDAAKQKLNKQMEKKTNAGDTAAVEKLTAKIQALEKEMANLASQQNVVAKESEVASAAVNNQLDAYQLLVKSYKDAAQNARILSAEFGVDSKEAKAAAAAAGEYKLQLDLINKSVKNGYKTPSTVVVPTQTTDNTDQVQRTGTLINEFDKAEADAAMTANEWAASQTKVAESVVETGTTVNQITGSLDQYTGTLRQNITAQIENAQALAANKAEQKEILAEMKASGVATDAQKTRLAELKEQQILLTESNKALNVTIRNQAQEFLAGEGSIDELQAKVNQLQQAYEQLSEAERASPFGQSLKAEIDVLEPKVKELEGTIGKFQRNVGNYPAAFIAPFQALEREIDVVQGKLVSGNFTGAAQEKLIAQQNALAKANALVNKEFTNSAAQANAFKQAATEIGIAYGADSEFAQKFTAQVKQSDSAVANVAQSFKKASTEGGGLSKTLTTAYNGLRKLAYLIPGLGIGGIVLLLLGPLQAAGAAIYKTVKDSMDNITEVSLEAQKQLKLYADAVSAVNEEYIKNSTAAVSKLELLRDVITDTTKTEKERVAALHDYNKIADKNNQIDATQLSNLNLINDSISRQITLVEQRALAAANEKILVDKAIALQLAENKAREDAIRQQEAEDAKTIETVQGAKTDAYFRTLEREGAIRQKIAQNDAVKQAQAEFDAQKKVNAEFLLKNGYVPGDDPKTKATEKIRKDQLRLEDEFNKKGLAALAKFNQDELTLLKNKYKEEADDQNNSLDKRKESLYKYYQVSRQLIEDDLKSQKDALDLEVTTAERRANDIKDPKKRADTIAAIEQYKYNKLKEITQDGNVKLEALDKQLFDEREKSFKESMDRQVENAKAANKLIQDNPNATPGEKAKAQTDEDNAIIRAQVGFYLQMVNLQKAFNLHSKTNWEDFRRTMRTETEGLNLDTKKLFLSSLDDIDKATDDAIVKIKLKYDKLKADILTGAGSNSNKNNAINLLDQTQAVEVGGTQQKANVAKVIGAAQLLDFGVITKKEFEQIYDAAVKGQQSLNDAIEKAKNSITSVKGLIGKGLGDLFGFKKGSGQAEVLAETISQAFSVAGDAMNSYFDHEANRIQQSLSLNEKRLDIELQQAKARAQSQAEQDTLDREFAAKKLEAEKKAFEQNKKLQIEQAKINLAIQLSNLAVIAFSPNPLNIATLGIAGTIMYAVQAALAVANYALNVSKIKSAQFAAAGGGKVPHLSNGRITHQQNIPTQRNGDNILATVKTNEVILNEEQQKKLGGAATFRAIGVPGFASGGITGLGNFNFSDKLQPPVNPSSFLNPKTNDDQLKLVYKAIDQQTDNINTLARQTNQRIDKLKVINVARETEKVNNNLKKASNIGRIA